MTDTSLRHWVSPSNPSRQAVELPDLHDNDPLPSDFIRATESHCYATFLVMRIEHMSDESLRRRQDAFMRTDSALRLCLAGTRTALEAVAICDADRVGLLLDDIDENTPISDLIWDRIEACRFSQGFVDRAARSVRVGCALEAMLGLVAELGLCALGSNSPPGGASLVERREFDYVPQALSAGVPPMPRFVNSNRAVPATLTR